MTRALRNLARRLAGPCPHCERRNELAVEAAAIEALAAERDYDEGVREVAGLGVAQLEAYLTGVGETR